MSGLAWHLTHLPPPADILHYQGIMQKITSDEEKQRLREYVENDTVRPAYATYETVLSYLHAKVNFPKTYSEDEYLTIFRMNNANHEDAIEILEFGLGRCGEFSITYTALLLAYGYEARMVMCLSDHVWVEVKTNDGWMHIDPTEWRIDDPFMYERDWGKSFGFDVVYAIEPNKITDVTSQYKYVENE